MIWAQMQIHISADRPVSARYTHIHICIYICYIEDTLDVTVHVYWHEVPRWEQQELQLELPLVGSQGASWNVDNPCVAFVWESKQLCGVQVSASVSECLCVCVQHHKAQQLRLAEPQLLAAWNDKYAIGPKVHDFYMHFSVASAVVLPLATPSPPSLWSAVCNRVSLPCSSCVFF